MTIHVEQVTAEAFVKESMAEYGKYVVLDRALPDARDGLKPVQRRILYAMHRLGLKPGNGWKKSAKIVGDTMGDFHPHGDGSIYGALCSMAVPWSFKMPMIEPQGNFGGISGQSPAAMRYTEAGLSEFGHMNFEDKKYLTYAPTFDGSKEEPVTLSALLPSLLIEGYSGIALGFAGSAPAHNVLEVAKLALKYHQTKEVDLLVPDLENPVYLLSSDAALKELYSDGQGTLSYCSFYRLDEKNKRIHISGLAPGISIYSIRRDLKDLIDKELIEFFGDDNMREVDIEITLKDTRLLESRILPAISSKDSYQFWAVNASDKIEKFNLAGLLEIWRSYRIELWSKRIADMIKVNTRELLELETQLAIIQNYDKFIEAIKKPTLTEIKTAFTFIHNDMKDYALSLKIQQIVKMNEASLKEKIDAIKAKIKFWSETTPEIQLEQQLSDLISHYESLKIKRVTTRIKWDELPRFANTQIQKHWVVAYDKSLEIGTEAPTRGRGFAGIAITECRENFSIVTEKGWQEQVSIFHQPKQFNYIQYNGKPIALIPDVGGLIVMLDEKNCMHVRANEKGEFLRQLTKDTKIKQLVIMQPGDTLRIRYKDSKLKVMTYEQVLNRCTTRATAGYQEYRGYQNPAEVFGVAHQGKLYTSEGIKNPEKSLSSKDVKIFNVGKRNFTILKTGQRQVLTLDGISKLLDQVESNFILE